MNVTIGDLLASSQSDPQNQTNDALGEHNDNETPENTPLTGLPDNLVDGGNSGAFDRESLISGPGSSGTVRFEGEDLPPGAEATNFLSDCESPQGAENTDYLTDNTQFLMNHSIRNTEPHTMYTDLTGTENGSITTGTRPAPDGAGRARPMGTDVTTGHPNLLPEHIIL